MPRLGFQAKLRQALLERKHRDVIAIVAPSPNPDTHPWAGGQGKTSAATALVNDAQAQSTMIDGIFWVSLGAHTSLITKLEQLASAAAGGQSYHGFSNVVNAVHHLQAAFAGKQFALVLDNVFTVGQLMPFVRIMNRAPRSCCIVTTRFPEVMRSLELAPEMRSYGDVQSFELPLLDDKFAESLLRTSAGQSLKDYKPAVIVDDSMSEWVSMYGKDGAEYFYNVRTLETAWENPDHKETLATLLLDAAASAENPKELSPQQQIELAFDRFDTDDSGLLDAKELEELIKFIGYNMSGKQLHEALSALDRNGDGCISKEEFLQWWEEPPTMQVVHHLQKIPAAIFLVGKLAEKSRRNWVEILEILQREEDDEEQERTALKEEYDQLRDTNAADIAKEEERDRVLQVQRCYALQGDAPHRLPCLQRALRLFVEEGLSAQSRQRLLDLAAISQDVAFPCTLLAVLWGTEFAKDVGDLTSTGTALGHDTKEEHWVDTLRELQVNQLVTMRIKLGLLDEGEISTEVIDEEEEEYMDGYSDDEDEMLFDGSDVEEDDGDEEEPKDLLMQQYEHREVVLPELVREYCLLMRLGEEQERMQSIHQRLLRAYRGKQLGTGWKLTDFAQEPQKSGSKQQPADTKKDAPPSSAKKTPPPGTGYLLQQLPQHLAGASGLIAVDGSVNPPSEAKAKLRRQAERMQKEEDPNGSKSARKLSLSDHLRLPMSLVSLHFNHVNRLSLSAVKALSMAIARSHALKYLAITDAGLTMQGIEELAVVLKSNEHIDTVVVDTVSNNIPVPLKLQDLNGNTRKQSLLFPRHSFGMFSVSLLASLLQTNDAVTDLDLSGNHIKAPGGEVIAKMLLRNKTLTSLNLADNQLAAEGGALVIKSLKKNRSIKMLSLKGNGIGEQGAIALSDLLRSQASALASLDASFNDISLNSEAEDGIAAIAQAIKTNNQITILNLAHNYIKETGITLFARDAILKKRTLTELDLSQNRIGRKGALVVGDALRKNGYLRQLGLEDNEIDPDTALKIRKICKNKGIKVSIEEEGEELEEAD
jgi:Ran GTPase-activating protein (RanGAP) involved in mRNA processing and transport